MSHGGMARKVDGAGFVGHGTHLVFYSACSGEAIGTLEHRLA